MTVTLSEVVIGVALRRDAMTAWRRFVWCVGQLPEDQAAPFWQTALADYPLV